MAKRSTAGTIGGIAAAAEASGLSSVASPRRALRLALVLCATFAGGLLLAAATALAASEAYPGGHPPEWPTTGAYLSPKLHPQGEATEAAILYGSLNISPEVSENRTGYYFLYEEGQSCMGGTQVVPGVGQEEGNELFLSVELTGLKPNTTYAYCLVATYSPDRTLDGVSLTFTTANEAPKVLDESTQAVGSTAAVLGAQVDMHNEPGSYSLIYAPNTWRQDVEEGNLASPDVLVQGKIPVALSAQEISVPILCGLAPSTVYDYRFVAIDAWGLEEGPVQSFATSESLSQSGIGTSEGACPAEGSGPAGGAAPGEGTGSAGAGSNGGAVQGTSASMETSSQPSTLAALVGGPLPIGHVAIAKTVSHLKGQVSKVGAGKRRKVKRQHLERQRRRSLRRKGKKK
jgi:hypothetical protein